MSYIILLYIVKIKRQVTINFALQFKDNNKYYLCIYSNYSFNYNIVFNIADCSFTYIVKKIDIYIHNY